jgi:hypothetical protein
LIPSALRAKLGGLEQAYRAIIEALKEFSTSAYAMVLSENRLRGLEGHGVLKSKLVKGFAEKTT